MSVPQWADDIAHASAALASQFVGGAFNWQYGSAMALFLMSVVLILVFATSRFLRAGGGGL